MKKKLLLMLTLCLLAQWSVAQAPKWVDKAKRAVFSVVTYDRNDKILNTGNGFFVTEDGVALSDYTLFKGAQRAVVVGSDGAQMPVEAIMGADDMYDVVKFRVGISGKKVTALTLAAVAPAVGADVYLLPYSTQKDRSFTAGKVKEADKISGNYSYYTLDMRLKDKMVSCPLMTMDGQVFGLAQKSSGQDTATICYAIDANFCHVAEYIRIVLWRYVIEGYRYQEGVARYRRTGFGVPLHGFFPIVSGEVYGGSERFHCTISCQCRRLSAPCFPASVHVP